MIQRKMINFWKQIIFQQSTPEIVFAAITPAVVREILEKQPENYKTMVKNVYCTLKLLLVKMVLHQNMKQY